ncbi:hypothetical protein MRBLWO14_002825 [Microbacterium sp. LWO14-1.2]|uniref:hypothetical protein n=1 Tax=Microbacterium sp. LWO14-1.2 TaxID=3135263 RepID=UPI003138AB30
MWSSLAIPVSFGPHEGDWIQIALTAVSIIASSAVAVLAYRNGKRATSIAEEAAERDQDHRDRELRARQRAERAAVSLAMMRALAAQELLLRPDLMQWQTSFADVEKEAFAQLMEARAQIDVYSAATEEPPLRDWFDDAVGNIQSTAQKGSPYRQTALGLIRDARRGIAAWDRIQVN